MPPRSLLNSFNSERAGFLQKVDRAVAEKCDFKRKHARLAGVEQPEDVIRLLAFPLCTSEEPLLRAAPSGCRNEYSRYSVCNMGARAFQRRLVITLA